MSLEEKWKSCQLPLLWRHYLYYELNLPMQILSFHPMKRQDSIIQRRFLQRLHHQDILLYSGSAKNLRSSSVFWQCKASLPSLPASQIILPSADTIFYQKNDFTKALKLLTKGPGFVLNWQMSDLHHHRKHGRAQTPLWLKSFANLMPSN